MAAASVRARLGRRPDHGAASRGHAVGGFERPAEHHHGVGLRAPALAAAVRGGRRLLRDPPDGDRARPGARAAGDGAGHARGRHRRRDGAPLLRERGSDRQVAQDRRDEVSRRRCGQEARERVRLLARQVRRRAAQLAGAPPDAAGQPHRHAHDPLALQAGNAGRDGAGAPDDARAPRPPPRRA